MKRILKGAILGCLVLFVWGAVSHMILFIGSGFTPLPNEDRVIQTLKETLPTQGLYFFPGKNFRQKYSPEQESAFMKKFETGPAGMIIYRPVGGNPLSPNKLIIQLVCNFITTLIISFVLSLVAASFWKRVFIAGLLGSLACASVSSIYWNWYEFPSSFFLAQCLDQIIGCSLAGLVIARH